MAKKAVMVRLEPELVAAIEARAAEKNLSLSTWVAKAAEAQLKSKGTTLRYVTEVEI